MAILPIRCNVRNTPHGNILSTNVQDTCNELDDKKVAKAGDTMSGDLVIINIGYASKLTLSSATIIQASGFPLTFNKPIRLDDIGSLPANITSGAIEFVGGRFYITSANRRVISRASDVMTSSIIISNTSAEYSLFSGQIRANTLLVGKMYKIDAYGTLSTHDAADKVTIVGKMNGTDIVELETTAGLVTNSPWYCQIVATVRGEGVNGHVASFGHIQFEDKHINGNQYSTHINTISVNAFGITAKWDNANVDNIIRIDQSVLHAID